MKWSVFTSLKVTWLKVKWSQFTIFHLVHLARSEVYSHKFFSTSFAWIKVKCIHLNFSPLLSLGWKWSVFTSFFLYFFHLAKSEVNSFHFFSLGWKFTSEQVKEEWFHVHFHFFALHQKYTSSEVKLTFTLFTSLLVKSSQVCRSGCTMHTTYPVCNFWFLIYRHLPCICTRLLYNNEHVHTFSG